MWRPRNMRPNCPYPSRLSRPVHTQHGPRSGRCSGVGPFTFTFAQNRWFVAIVVPSLIIASHPGGGQAGDVDASPGNFISSTEGVMRESVRRAFHDFSADLEGRDVDFFYLDYREPPKRCLVTIWLGNLCPLSFALTLPMVHPDGRYATKSEIAAAWNIVDSRQDLAKHGGMVFGGLKGNELRLPKEAGEDMVKRKLDQTDATLRAMFGDAWTDWPACAQLAVISWAWAVGPHSSYPRMHAALHDRDFLRASEECEINPKRGTIVTRNRRNQVLLRNAARVQAFRFDPDVIEWTRDLSVSDEETQPALPTTSASRPTRYPAPEEVTGSGGTIHVGADMYRLDRDPGDSEPPPAA